MSRKEQLLKFLEHNPHDSFVKFALALEHISADDDDTALDYFKDILQQDPDYTGTYYHLGKLYQRKNERSLAEQTFQEGLRRTAVKEPHAYSELQHALNELNEDADL